jgi:hypothetical protein
MECNSSLSAMVAFWRQRIRLLAIGGHLDLSGRGVPEGRGSSQLAGVAVGSLGGEVADVSAAMGEDAEAVGWTRADHRHLQHFAEHMVRTSSSSNFSLDTAISGGNMPPA